IDLIGKQFVINHTVTKGTTINRLNTTKTETSARTYPLNAAQVMMFQHLKEKERENRKLFGNAYIVNDYIFNH
ncbi:MAG: hypothetical protein IJT32_04270, partial [Lachnospiraceae bacterium]|nr:hypothetical protein [Lachnospiraceae bacterium]